jgi:hypothetical protein
LGSVALQNPERCVGPVKLRPIFNDAFERGIRGEDPLLNASRLEGALLWFFYISSYKEATSATEAAKDVDSCWAKYTGGETREGEIGLSRYVRLRSAQVHDRIWDALLAVRCWRNTDNSTGAASNLALRDRARAQLDRAYFRGLSLIVRQRVQSGCAAGWEATRIVGQVLDREATARNPELASTLRTELGKAMLSEVDVPRLVSALDALFPCS